MRRDATTRRELDSETCGGSVEADTPRLNSMRCETTSFPTMVWIGTGQQEWRVLVRPAFVMDTERHGVLLVLVTTLAHITVVPTNSFPAKSHPLLQRAYSATAGLCKVSSHLQRHANRGRQRGLIDTFVRICPHSHWVLPAGWQLGSGHEDTSNLGRLEMVANFVPAHNPHFPLSNRAQRDHTAHDLLGVDVSQA